MSPPNAATMAPPPTGVRVRMYRPKGLGDCFLLAFRAGDDGARYMLIDCGVLVGTRGGSARLKKVAADIAEATGGHLHVLVATHQHWDHLSGLQYARKAFEQMEIDEVWVAWTEDPSDPLAQRLREGRAMALRALTAATRRLTADGKPMGARIDEVLGFFGPLGAQGSTGTAAQMEYAVQRAEARYRRPGEPPVQWPDSSVRFYVLGPPVDESLLFRSNPSKKHSEVYETGLGLDPQGAFYVSVLGADGDENGEEVEAAFRRSQPFDTRHRVECDFESPPAESAEFFRAHYGFGDVDEDAAPAWRRIGTDWLAGAGNLALDLDGDTNNTSLVLAIELHRSQKVLLFPADAQVGNWLSWDQVSWHEPHVGPVRAADLLRRTVLYKVGHHGSHNATLREKGLELMESPELVAMVPVDEKQAEKKEWAMPFQPLYERLKEKTHGRVIRADTGVPKKRPTGVAKEDWDAFLARIAMDESGDDLWIEYLVEDE